MHPTGCLCQTPRIHVIHLVSSPSVMQFPLPTGPMGSAPSLEEGLSDARILHLLCYYLVHNQSSFPTAHFMFALFFPLWVSLSTSACNCNPLKYLFHALAA